MALRYVELFSFKSLFSMLSTQIAHSEGRITYTHPYIASVTEREVWRGVLEVAKPERQALCVLRTFHEVLFSAKYADELSKYAGH